MRYKQLGITESLASEICLATMTYGGRGFWYNRDGNGPAESRRVSFDSPPERQARRSNEAGGSRDVEQATVLEDRHDHSGRVRLLLSQPV